MYSVPAQLRPRLRLYEGVPAHEMGARMAKELKITPVSDADTALSTWQILAQLMNPAWSAVSTGVEPMDVARRAVHGCAVEDLERLAVDLGWRDVRIDARLYDITSAVSEAVAEKLAPAVAALLAAWSSVGR